MLFCCVKQKLMKIVLDTIESNNYLSTTDINLVLYNIKIDDYRFWFSGQSND